MIVYSVYEPGKEAPDIAVRAERLAFVKEGFSWPAFFLPALWLIYQRMWIELVVFVIACVALQWAFGSSDQGQALFGWASLALVVLFAFEANDLRTAALERRGYQLAGVASGRDRTDAERSFFRAWLPQQVKAARGAERGPERGRDGAVAKPAPRGESEEVIGLFPRP